jgi:hypothetical protein
MKRVLGIMCLAIMTATSTQAETINRRGECDAWEYIPSSDVFGNAATALLFCNRDTEKWLALRIECDVAGLQMAVRYRPGFVYTAPESEQEQKTGAEGMDQLSAEDRAAAALVAAIPYVDSGIKTQPEPTGGPAEMVFMDFQSFGYTGVAHYDGEVGDWAFVEKEPLSPIFSRMMTGNYADIKLLGYGNTERFPLRGSNKALRPVIQACLSAKQAAAAAQD